MAGVWLRGVTVIGEELRHFWQGFFKRMPVPRGHGPLGKHAKIGVQDVAGSHLVELGQERNRHFHSGQMLAPSTPAVWLPLISTTVASSFG